MGAYAAVGLMAAATLVSTAGAVQQGNQAKKIGTYQAAVASNNALIAEQNADYAIKAGQQQAATESMKGAATVGAIKSAQAASGVDVNTGSAVDVQESERLRSALDTQTVMHNAQLKAYGYRTQATNFEAEAGLRTAEGDAAKSASRTKALSTLLSGASSTAWMGAKMGPSSYDTGLDASNDTYGWA